MNYAAQARALCETMTLEEKSGLIHGVTDFCTHPVERLNVPALRMSDASLGLHAKEPSTAFPAAVALAASWNRELAGRYGRAVAEEFRAHGIYVLLGPGINIYRLPQCGRNFEYLGEDPFLTSELVVSYIQAAQSTGVAATVKHLVCNNSDWHRTVSNSVVDERTLREIYFPGFEAAVTRGKVRALMTSYNLLNGEYTGESRWLVTDVLKKEWGFDGLIMSDWGGVWHGLLAAQSGIHLEIQDCPESCTPENLRQWIADGKLRESDLDQMVEGMLRFVLEAAATLPQTPECPGKCPAHATVALETAREGIVLLRNEHAALPLPKTLGSIAVLGPNAHPTPTSGGGAARVKAIEPVSIRDAIHRFAPAARLIEDEAQIAQADAVVVCVGFNAVTEGEALDRPFDLPEGQADLIRRCAASHRRTVVVITSGGGVEMPSWIADVAAVVQLWYPGENGCQALAEILFGDVAPSGKLPISIERRLADNPTADHYLPAGEALYDKPIFLTPPSKKPAFDLPYTEGVLVGYRHFDTRGIEPLFPFGFGLSYTTFAYGDLALDPLPGDELQLSFTVTNTGARPGKETAQIYVRDVESSVIRPVRELKGFEKAELEPGETRRITVRLDRRAFQFWDPASRAWKLEPGEFEIAIGGSSRDLPLRATYRVE